LGTLNEILEWAKYIANILSVVVSIYGFYDIYSASVTVTAEAAENTPWAAVGTFLRGSCAAAQIGQKPSWKWVEYIQIPVQILSCAPGGTFTTITNADGSKKEVEVSGVEKILGENNWYFYWQRSVLETYNVATGRTMLGIPATSLYDNMYVSAIGLCIPGLFYNLQQLREIHCRRIVCLQQEVPQGIATVEACDNLFDLQNCEFWAGPGFALIPGISTLSVIGDALKGLVSNPIGIIMTVLDLAACSTLCFVKGGSAALIPCKAVRFIEKALDIIESIIGFTKQTPKMTKSPYCDMVKKDLPEPAVEESGVTEA